MIDARELTASERLVRDLIAAHRGHAQAVPLRALAAGTGLYWRDVQQIVKHLIEAHHCPIGSATGKPHGYYWIVDEEDQARAEAQLRHRIVSCARRLALLERNTPRQILAQLALELDAEASAVIPPDSEQETLP